MLRDRWRALLAILLIVAAGLFAVGAVLERHEHRAAESNPAAEAAQTPTSGESAGEGGESGEHQSPSPEASGSESTHSQSETSDHSELTFLGLDLESPWVVGLAVAASVALGLVVLAPWTWPLWAAAAFGLFFGALDIREVAFQVDRSRASLVTIALVLAVMRFAVAAIAVAIASRGRAVPA